MWGPRFTTFGGKQKICCITMLQGPRRLCWCRLNGKFVLDCWPKATTSGRMWSLPLGGMFSCFLVVQLLLCLVVFSHEVCVVGWVQLCWVCCSQCFVCLFNLELVCVPVFTGVCNVLLIYESFYSSKNKKKIIVLCRIKYIWKKYI